MVVPRKWKLVAGAMSATVALGASAAIAEEGSPRDESDKPLLTEKIDISQLPHAADLGDVVLLQVEPDDAAESPLDQVSGADESVDSESLDSESLDSESVESESFESESVESESVPSEDSVSND